MSSQWRRFQFFDKQQLVIPPSTDTSGIPSSQTLDAVEICAASSGRGYISFGDTKGMVHIVRSSWRWSTFRAYQERLIAMHQLRSRNFLVTIGDDREKKMVLKIWELKLPVDEGEPPPVAPPSPFFATTAASELRSFPVFGPNESQQEVTTMCATESLDFIAIGLANGAVTLLRGDILANRFTRTKFLPTTSSAEVTALSFKHVPSQPTVLFSVTTNAVNCHRLISDGEDQSELLDTSGCEVGCAVQHTVNKNMLVARPEAIFFYEYDGKDCSPGPCFAFEGLKKKVISLGSYLLVVGAEEHQPNVDGCKIYDLDNKYIAMHTTFTKGVKWVLHEWNTVVVITGDNKIYQLAEKDIPTKLNMLFRKNLYEVAAELAQTSNLDKLAVADIFRQYGDHQYDKGDFDGAMTQYIRTIGKGVEPSYVIQRFLDATSGGAERINNLIRYLKSLHEAAAASPDHTTLLMNCYTQLGDLDELNAFIDQDGLQYDQETAINVCRQAEFYEQGLYLAKKHQQHGQWLRIQLENKKDYKDALEYISRLPSFDGAKRELLQCVRSISTYGRQLVTHLPKETTDLAIQLCTGYTQGGAGEHPADPHPEDYMDIFLDDRKALTVFLQRVMRLLEADEEVKISYITLSKVNNTLLELYLQQAHTAADRETGAAETAEKKGSGEGDEEDELSQEVAVAKAMQLVEQHHDTKIDLDRALVLCQQYDFPAGALHLLEIQHMHRHILQHHMDHGERGKLLSAIHRIGGQDDTLWSEVLRYFTSQGNECAAEIAEILETIEQQKLLPPIMVLAIIAGPTSTLSLEVAKSYLTRNFKADSEMIESNNDTIENHREDSVVKKAEMAQLLEAAKPGELPLIGRRGADTPSAHFLRLHAAHLQYIGEDPATNLQGGGGGGGPARTQSTARPVNNLQDEFIGRLTELREMKRLGAEDSFGFMAEHFSQNLFSEVPDLAGGVSEI